MSCKGVGGKNKSQLPARQKKKNKQMTNARKIRNHDYVVDSRILKNKIDEIGLKYRKFKNAFPSLLNSFSIHSEHWLLLYSTK
jgi:hypothetical protein